MDCDHARPFLDELAEGELRSPQKEMVEDHLRVCLSCQEEFSATYRTIRLMEQFGEVDEPPDFLRQVRQKMAAPPQYSLLERLLRQPSIAKGLVPVACLALVAFGAWLVYRQFSPPTPARVARHRREARAEPEVIARAYPEKKAFRAETTEGVALPTPATEEKAMVPGRVEHEHVPVPARAGVRSREEEARATLDTPAKKQNAALPTPKGYYRNATGGLLEKAASTERPAPTETTAETEEHVALRYDLSTQKRGGESWHPAPGGPDEKLSEKQGREAFPGVAGDAHLKKALAGTEEVQRAVPPPEPSTQFVAGTGAIAGQPIRGKAAVSDIATPSEQESPLAFSDREPSEKPSGTTEPEAKQATPEIAAGENGRFQPEQARKQEIISPIEEFKAPVPTLEDEREVASFENGSRVRSVSNDIAQTQQARPASELAQILHLNGTADAIPGGAFNLDRYHALSQTVPELLLTVKDRGKALAEVQEFVKKRGGRAEFFHFQQSKAAVGAIPAEADLVLVTLPAGAYKDFDRKFLPREVSRGLSLTDSGWVDATEVTESRGQQQNTVTFLIRLVEMAPQGQQQQPSHK